MAWPTLDTHTHTHTHAHTKLNTQYFTLKVVCLKSCNNPRGVNQSADLPLSLQIILSLPRFLYSSRPIRCELLEVLPQGLIGLLWLAELLSEENVCVSKTNWPEERERDTHTQVRVTYTETSAHTGKTDTHTSVVPPPAWWGRSPESHCAHLWSCATNRQTHYNTATTVHCFITATAGTAFMPTSFFSLNCSSTAVVVVVIVVVVESDLNVEQLCVFILQLKLQLLTSIPVLQHLHTQ